MRKIFLAVEPKIMGLSALLLLVAALSAGVATLSGGSEYWHLAELCIGVVVLAAMYGVGVDRRT